MKKYNKTCIVCSEKYTFCTSCSEYDKYPRWKAIYCCENCKDIFHITSDYIEKTITKDEAREKLNKCDLSNKNKFHYKILEAIDEIFAEAQPKFVYKNVSNNVNKDITKKHLKKVEKNNIE